MCKNTDKDITSFSTVTTVDSTDYFLLSSGEKISLTALSALIGGNATSIYSSTSGSATAQIFASNTGVTISQSSEVITVSIPESVDLKMLNLFFPNSILNSGKLHVLLDYAGVRLYNISKQTVNMPVCRAGSDTITSANRTSPANISEQGGPASGNVIYGISAISGGDGSDLEVTFQQLSIASNIWVNMIFGI